MLAVCDVYDALISPRVYRPARSHDEALGLLREGIDLVFADACVKALEQVVARDLPVSLAAA